MGPGRKPRRPVFSQRGSYNCLLIFTKYTPNLFHYHYMSLIMRKPVFGVSDQVPHKPGCTATEDGQRLQILDLGSRGIVLFVTKSKVLISCTVTVQLICIFGFAYAKSRFSHDTAHILESACNISQPKTNKNLHFFRLTSFLSDHACICVMFFYQSMKLS